MSRERALRPRESREDDDRCLFAWHQVTAISAAVDASDPYLTIRRLIALVESLQSEVRGGSKRGRDAAADDDDDDDDDEDVGAELERLRVENNNMYQIREENERLKAEVRGRRTDDNALAALRAENEDLRSRLGDCEARLQALHLAEITGVRPGTAQTAAEPARPKTAAEIIDECAGDMDDELEDLFRTNAASLSQLRSDVEAYQREVGVDPSPGAPPKATPPVVEPIALCRAATPPLEQTARDPDVDTPAHVNGKPLWDPNSPPPGARGAERPEAAVAPAPLAPPSPSRPGSRAGRLLKAKGTSDPGRTAPPAASRPKTPSLADILASRRTYDDSDDDHNEEAEIWNAALTPRARDGASAVSDRVTTTKHAWLLMGDDADAGDAPPAAEESKLTDL